MALSLRGLFRKAGSGSTGSVTAAAHTPDAIRSALTQHGMDLSGNFGPGRPLSPYFGYSQRTRATDFPVGVNISTRSRASWGRVSFDTLKALIDAYDVARMCVNHKIDELRSMPLMYQPADSVDDDVDDAIDAAKAALAYPDRELPYDSWLSKWLENALKYDSAPLYRRRNYDGDIIALEIIDGRTINPYIDEHGRRPQPPAPAYYQTVHGMVADWLTTQDIIYNPFRPQEDSPFGLAPIESIILTANTDIRFQWHFLQMFTEGSVPAGFMEVPPDVSSPDQVAEWQDYWDATVMGDQAKLHQLIAVPAGSHYQETHPTQFDPKFPEYLMMRTCAAFGVVPQDLGLVKDVNRANGETQVDVQFRVNTMPWVRYVEGHLTRYLQHDLGLPVKVSLDTGRDKEDRLAEAQAHQLYVDMGAESPDEVRVDILGKRIDRERPTPRFYSTQRIGPVPLLAIEGVAGKTDPDTYGPAKDQQALDQPFVPPIGVIPHPGSTDDKASQAAIDAYQVAERQQLDAEEASGYARESAAERDARGAQTPQPPAPVTKTATGEAAGELAAFRVFVKGARRRGTWDRDFTFTTVPPAVAEQLNRGGRAEVAAVAKAGTDSTAQAVYDQLAENFPPEAIGWVKDLRWSGPVSVPLEQVDFSNQDTWAASGEPGRVDKTVRKIRAGKPVKPAVLIARPGRDALMVADGHHRAEAAQRAGVPLRAYIAHPDKPVGPWDEMHSSQQIRKTGGPVVAGLAVRATDTGRILMIQRGQDPADAAAGMWEFPGGHIDAGEAPPSAARREWQEEVGRPLPDGTQTGAWTSPNGVYAGYVWTIGAEDTIRIDDPRNRTLNPDDPGRDHIEAIAWWDPEHLADNPAVRTELAADLATVLPQLGAGQLAKAGARSPKGPAPDGQGPAAVSPWPGWSRDQHLARIYAAGLREMLKARVDTDTLAASWLAANPVRKSIDVWATDNLTGDGSTAADDAATDAATAADAGLGTARDWLDYQGVRTVLAAALGAVLTDAWTEGYVLGDRSATAMVAGGRVDWGLWKPGDPQAANLVLGLDGNGDGLAQLLRASGVRIKSIGDGRLDELARSLALSLETGESPDTLARDLRDILDNDRWAYSVAVTEINRAVSAATLATYAAMDVEGKEWLTAADQRVCPTCERNGLDGAIPLRAEFSSGDTAPPAHPGGCRCALGPADLTGGDAGD